MSRQGEWSVVSSGPVAWRAFAARFVAMVLGLMLVCQIWGARAALSLLPMLKAEIAWLDNTYLVQSLALDTEGADRVVRLVVSQQRYIHLAGQVHEPHPLGRANASTLMGHLWLPWVVLVAAVMAWPMPRALRWTCWAWRCVVLLPASAWLTAVNVPIVLWAGIWRLHVDAFAPESIQPLLMAADFLQSGGEYALALLLAAMCLRTAAWLTQARSSA